MATREPRPLKKTKLGPPDVYRQESSQMEDVLNQSSVQKGFSNPCPFPNESASALGDLHLSSLVGQLKRNFEEILTVKQKLNTLQDGGRRKPQKEHFWPVTPKIKEATSQWFVNLATNSKFPPSLTKKIPIFHKKEEILDHLCEHSVPLLRAAWFLKMTATYYSSVSEAKISKKRQTGNAAQEWTLIITRYLKDVIKSLTEYYCNVMSSSNLGSANTSSLFPQHQRPHIENAQKQWTYLARLACWMYEDGLLHVHVFLTWLIDQWKALKPTDDGLLKLILPQTFQYLHDILRSQLLSRNLANVCCWKLSYLLKPDEENGEEADNLSAGENENDDTGGIGVRLKAGGMSAVKGLSSQPPAEYPNCSYHQNMVMSLTSIVQSITLHCPTALLWMPSAASESSVSQSGPSSVGSNSGKGDEENLNGWSPLDQLPYAPSELPLSSRLNPELTEQIICHLQSTEDEICLRSAAAERLWTSREYNKPSESLMMTFVLKLMEELDKYDYNKALHCCSVEGLYAKIFVRQHGSNEVGLAGIELIVPLLCDWAVNSNSGHVYRVYVVARLFHMAQAALQKILSGARDMSENEGVDDARASSLLGDQQEDDDDDAVSVASLDCVRFPLRDCLIHYLDTQAPLPGPDDGDSSFHHLVILFGELIRTGVFSYSHYLSTLISRGDLQASPVQQETLQTAMDEQKEDLSIVANFGLVHGSRDAELSDAAKNLNESTEDLESQMDFSTSQESIETLDKKNTRKGVKRLHSLDDRGEMSSPSKYHCRSDSDTQTQMETLFGELSDSAPDSVKSAESGRGSPHSSIKRHFHYALKFPIPEEMCSEYFLKQRLVVLFGVGQDRAEAAKELDQATEEVCQHLTHTEDNTSSASVVYQTSHEDAVKTFVSASQFSRCRVLHACHEKLLPRHGDSPVSQREQYERVSVESVEFLFELMELAGDVVLLLDLVQELLIGQELYESSSDEAEEPERLAGSAVGEASSQKNQVADMYVIGSKLVPSVLGVLWKYNRCVLLSRRTTQIVFEGLFRYIRQVSDPAACSNSERCVLVYLSHLYRSCEHLQTTFKGVFEKIAADVESNIYSKVKTAPTELKSTAAQFTDIFRDTRTAKDRIRYPLLRKSDDNLHSFVYRLMLAVIREDARNNMASLVDLCVNAVSQCKGLKSQLLCALRAMACPAEKKYGYTDLLEAMNYRLLTVPQQIAVFTSVLVARQCFSLTDVLSHVVQPSLKSARVHGGKAEQGVRLTCMLLQCLLTNQPSTSSVSAPSGGIFQPPQFGTSTTSFVMLPSDKRCLLASRELLDLPTIFTILKMLWRLSAASGGSRVASMSSNKTLTARTLTELCRQPWMKTLFLRDPDALCSKDMLMDMSLVASEARYLLQLVCYPDGEHLGGQRDEESHESVARIIENLKLWTFNVSWLELQLLIREHRDDEQQCKRVLDCIAQCSMDIFWSDANSRAFSQDSNRDVVWQLIGVSVWLVAPLVYKLAPSVQGMLLRAAGRILERDQWWKPNVERKIDISNPLAVPWQKPFLALVMASLNSQDQAKTDFLTSLHRQLTQFLSASERERHPMERNAAVFAQEALRLRLSMVGAMFDTLLRNKTQCGEWCVLLMHLMTSGTVTRTSNYGHLYTTVFDMLSTLLEDGRFLNEQAALPTSDEPGRKTSIPIMKRLKKEVHLCLAKQVAEECKILLPLPQRKIKVPKVEPCEEPGKKTGLCPQGYRITGHQFIDPWDVLEGAKNSGPLSLSLFGAVRMERKALTKYEQQFQAVRYNKIPRPFVSCKVRRVVVADSSSEDEEGKQQVAVKQELLDETVSEVQIAVTNCSDILAMTSSPVSVSSEKHSPVTGRRTPQLIGHCLSKGRETPSKLIGHGLTVIGGEGQSRVSISRQLSEPLQQDLQGKTHHGVVSVSTSGMPRPKFLPINDQLNFEDAFGLPSRSLQLQTRSQPTTPVVCQQTQMPLDPLTLHQSRSNTGTPIADMIVRAAVNRSAAATASGTPTRSLAPVGGFTMQLSASRQQAVVHPIAQRPVQKEQQLLVQQQQNPAINKRPPIQIGSSSAQTFLTPNSSLMTTLQGGTPIRTIAIMASQPQQQQQSQQQQPHQQQQQLSIQPQQGHQQQILQTHLRSIQQRHQQTNIHSNIGTLQLMPPQYSPGASNLVSSIGQANFTPSLTQQSNNPVASQSMLRHQLLPTSQVLRTQQHPQAFSQIQSVQPQTMVVQRTTQEGGLQAMLSGPPLQVSASRLSQVQIQPHLQQQQQTETPQQTFLQYQRQSQQNPLAQYQRQLSGGQGGGTS